MKKSGKKNVVDLKPRSVEDNTGLTHVPESGTYPFNERSYREEYVPASKPSIHRMGDPVDHSTHYPPKITSGGEDTLAARHNRKVERERK